MAAVDNSPPGPEWTHPTPDDLERRIQTGIRELARDSAKLAQLRGDPERFTKERTLLARRWDWIIADLALLRAEERKQTKQATRDALHGQLCSIITESESPNRGEPAPIAYRNAIKATLAWLARWAT